MKWILAVIAFLIWVCIKLSKEFIEGSTLFKKLGWKFNGAVLFWWLVAIVFFGWLIIKLFTELD